MDQCNINLRRNELRENKEEFRLIWLDENINNSDDSIKTQRMLLELNPATQFYTDSVRCIDVIKSIIDEKILFIISGSCARNNLSHVRYCRSIIAVFIFCVNYQHYQSLKDKYDKIVDIFVDQDNLLKSIHETLNLLEKQTITFSLLNEKGKISKDLSKESASFLWHQMIFYILEQMPQNEQSKQDLIDKCKEYYQFNKEELKNIDDFQKTYCREQAIKWYTKECFLYKLLNKTLRTEDFLLIYSFRFFIIDLCYNIKQEHIKSKTKQIFTTYRGQKMPIDEFNKWKNNIGTIISINGFFSTSLDKNVSLDFARQNIISDKIQSILFEIDVDPSLNTVICADISHKSQHPNEQEILFSLNCSFKIISINNDSIDNIWKIKLQTTDEGRNNAEQYLTSIQQQIEDSSPMICFGWLLINKLGQVDRAEKYFHMLLKTLPSVHPEIAAIYNGIGRVYSEKKQFDLALKNYEIAYKIRLEQLPPNHPHIAISLHNIATIIKDNGNFDQALEYYQKALNIREINDTNDNLQKAIIIQNIGNTYIDKNYLNNALQYLSHAHEILQNILPEKHPEISACLGNIGSVYEKKGDLLKALEYYHKELEMDEYCLPSDHPHISKDIKKILLTYKKNNEINKALEFCRKKLDIQKDIHGNNHPPIIRALTTMAKILEEINFKESYKYYREALRYLKNTTPIDYQTIAKCLRDTGYLCSRYKVFNEALSFLGQALNWYHQFLPPDHIDLANVYKIIAICYQKTNKSSEALNYFNKTLSIYQTNYESDHPDMKSIKAYIDKLNDEQNIPTSSTEQIQEIINDEQNTHINSTEQTQEIINNEQLNADVINLSISDLSSTSKSDSNKSKSETKIPVIRKICANCQIL